MIRTAMILALAIGITADFSAAQDEEKKKGKRQGGRNLATQMMARFKNIDLSDEQKGKMKEIVKKFSGPLQELRKESMAVMTPEMRKAQQEASKKARAEGLKGKELREAINKAVPASGEVAAKMKEIRGKMAGIQKEMREALTAVLTPEQKKKLPKRGPGPAGKGKKKKKKKEADK